MMPILMWDFIILSYGQEIGQDFSLWLSDLSYHQQIHNTSRQANKYNLEDLGPTKEIKMHDNEIEIKHSPTLYHDYAKLCDFR